MHRAYVVHHEVIDDQGDGEVRFLVMWTSQNMKERISEDITQDDATYRLMWQ